MKNLATPNICWMFSRFFLTLVIFLVSFSLAPSPCLLSLSVHLLLPDLFSSSSSSWTSLSFSLFSTKSVFLGSFLKTWPPAFLSSPFSFKLPQICSPLLSAPRLYSDSLTLLLVLWFSLLKILSSTLLDSSWVSLPLSFPAPAPSKHFSCLMDVFQKNGLEVWNPWRKPAKVVEMMLLYDC